jgi:hypothetical protein
VCQHYQLNPAPICCVHSSVVRMTVYPPHIPLLLCLPSCQNECIARFYTPNKYVCAQPLCERTFLHVYVRASVRACADVREGENARTSRRNTILLTHRNPNSPSFQRAFPPAAPLPVRTLADLFERLSVSPLLSSMTRNVFPLTVDTR